MSEELDYLWLAAQIEAVRMNLIMIFSEKSKLKAECEDSQLYRMVKKCIESDCDRLNQVRTKLAQLDTAQSEDSDPI